MSTPLAQKAEEFVKAELAGNDGSHDWFHIDRVRKLALNLAKEENFADIEVVELGALLHDIKDWKYSGSEHAGADAAREFLMTNGCPPETVSRVVHIISNIGFKTELGQIDARDADEGSSEPNGAHVKRQKLGVLLTQELAIVQDADRLDAVGAIGIARTFTYGGSRNRSLYDPNCPPIKDISKAQYMKQANSPTINHFYEKLLLLKGLMKTESGRRRAEARHAYLEGFLIQFFKEWEGEA